MREGFMAASGAMLIGTGAVGRRRAFWEASTLFLERSGAAHPGRTCPAGLGCCDCSCCPAAKTSRWFRSIPLFLLLAPACRSSRTLTSAATDHFRPPHQRLRCPPLHALPITQRPSPITRHAIRSQRLVITGSDGACVRQATPRAQTPSRNTPVARIPHQIATLSHNSLPATVSHTN